jgi:hypothetical protein
MNLNQIFGLALGLQIVLAATILHNPFGGYVWDDGLYSKTQVIRMIREGFPEYADQSDTDLWNAGVKEYPDLKSWIREDTNGSSPRAIANPNQPASYRLMPPPAYFDTGQSWRSVDAMATWIDEPTEYGAFLFPTVLASGLWYWHFRRRKAT